MSATTLAVAVQSAGKVFANGVRALTPITLTVGEGEFATVIGPSGCGKSTLLRMIAGLTAPSSGSVSLWPQGSGRGTGGNTGLAFVFQSATLMPWANVEKNVRLPLDLQGSSANAQRTVARALELVGLQDFRNAYPRELSGGMQMRASIARALVTEPRLLLMDEPFGALDEITRSKLDRDLRSLWAQQGLTVLFVTHSIYEAVFLSTRLLVMSARPGRIHAEFIVDEPHPREESFRGSEKFARYCALLSGALSAASSDSAAEAGIGS